MVNWHLIPGADLLKQAWDATKLVGTIIDRRQERAVALATERRQQVERFRGRNANARMKEIFESGRPDDFAKLFVPEPAVEAVKAVGRLYWKIGDSYWICLLLRMILAFVPLSGLLHATEFMAEIITGDVFRIDVIRPQSVNASFPVISVTTPMILYGIPMWAFRAADFMLFNVTGWSLISPYLLVILPRLSMFVLSLILDYCVFHICVIYKHSYNRCMTTMASSVVVLVYSTRAMLPSVEMLLGSALFYLVAHCMKRTAETVYLQSMVQEAYDKSESIRERVQLRKKMKKIPDHDFKNCLPISVVVALGVYNHPRFIIFASVPLFFWFQRGIAVNSSLVPFAVFHFRMLLLVPGFVVTSLTMLLVDSLYYGGLTLAKLWNLEMSWSDWKCTPFDLLMQAVAEETETSRAASSSAFSICCNLVVMFGPLSILLVLSSLNFVSEMAHNAWQRKPSVRSVYALTLFTCLFTIVCMSVLGLDDPTALLVLIMPMTLINAHNLFFRLGTFRPVLRAWYSFNAVLLVYGFLLQAGTLSTEHFIARHLPVGDDVRDVHVVFVNVSMPPKFSLMRPKRGEDPLYFHNSTNDLHVHFSRLVDDLSTSTARRKLSALVANARYVRHVRAREVFVVMTRQHCTELKAKAGEELTFQAVFYSDPFFISWWPKLNDRPSDFPFSLVTDLAARLNNLGLAVYRVDLKHVDGAETSTASSNELEGS